MSTWIIAYNKDGNTATMKVESGSRVNLDEAVELVNRKAEQEHYDTLDMPHEFDVEETPALRLVERYGITITGIAQES